MSKRSIITIAAVVGAVVIVGIVVGVFLRRQLPAPAAPITTGGSQTIVATPPVRQQPAEKPPLEAGKDAANPDRDFDGLTAEQEAKAGSDPAKYDTDGDGLSDGYEVLTAHTDPTKADTDGNGVNDATQYYQTFQRPGPK